MVFVYLRGGLGNQMYQYACAYSLSQRKGDSLCLITEHILHDHDNRKYELSYFEIPGNLTVSDKAVLFHDPSSFLHRAIRKVSKEWSWKLSPITGNYFWMFSGYRNFPKHFNRKNIYLDGYWQYEGYFKEFAEDIKKQFTLKKEFMSGPYFDLLKRIQSTNSVCIHVRLGDYLYIKSILLCDDEYYNKGIEIIQEKVSDPFFFVFSDEIDKARAMIGKSDNILFIPDDISDIESFSLMCSCKHFIISNSTYSWWAQYIAKKESSVVIAPKRWDKKMNDWITI